MQQLEQSILSSIETLKSFLSKDILCLSCIKVIIIDYKKFINNKTNEVLLDLSNKLKFLNDSEDKNIKDIKDGMTNLKNDEKELLAFKYMLWNFIYKKFETSNKIVHDLNEFAKVKFKNEIIDLSNQSKNTGYFDFLVNSTSVESRSNEKNNEKLNIVTLSRWPLCMIFIGGIICMGSSATFHLFCAHSLIVKKVFNRLDYAGISILIVFSCYPPYYYYLYCNFSNFFI